jgi:hypothetical protein
MGVCDWIADWSPARKNVVRRRYIPADDQVVRIVADEPDPNMTQCGHVLLAAFFYVVFLVYVVVSVIAFINVTPVATNSLLDARKYSPVPLKLTVLCKTGDCGSMYVISNYSAYPASRCYTPANKGFFKKAMATGDTTEVALCYTDMESISYAGTTDLRMSQVQVVFDNLTAGFGSVIVQSLNAAKTVNRQLSVDKGARSLNIGLQVETFNTEEIGFEPFSKQYQMDATRKNRADLALLMAPLAHVRNTRTQRTWFEVVADFGGAFESLQLVFFFIVPLWLIVFAVQKLVNRDDKKDKEMTEMASDVTTVPAETEEEPATAEQGVLPRLAKN